MSNNKQSSVDWLIDNIYLKDSLKWQEVIEQAKAMHQKEILKLYNDFQDYLDEEFKNQCGGQSNILTFEQYYNETFGGNNDQKQNS